ncbi:transcriptional regulator [Streptomyces sp. RKND-216]|uniref:DUF5324 family protein n=1 Tax=Streptomyces sp. RKND-216 TaxID=2562581 RepID=UPI00109DEFA8|nr:DUF5324 family protein [Streptomyces sp. RKND-216]THA25454.1 transcriptional regulator [Streptomyces sp. RKND-216]
MTRIDSARAAADSAIESVRHAAEAVAPYAESARDNASHYAHEAGAYLGPRVSSAAHQARSTARDNYDAHVVPRLAKARKSLPPEVDKAATRAAQHTRKAAKQANDYARPHLEQARSAAAPAGREAAARSTAAFAAVRYGVSARDIEKLARRRSRRAGAGRFAKRLAMLGLLAGGAYAAWRWWDKQANPDWLVEPPPPTEVIDEEMAAMDEADRAVLDPEVEAKQRDEDAR